MIHGDNLNFVGREILHRMVGSVMTLMHFQCFGANGKRQQLGLGDIAQGGQIGMQRQGVVIDHDFGIQRHEMPLAIHRERVDLDEIRVVRGHRRDEPLRDPDELLERLTGEADLEGAVEQIVRILDAGHPGQVESLGQALSLISTVSLDPEPIPLDAKVALVGDRTLYYLLAAYDPDFLDQFRRTQGKVAQVFRTEADAQAAKAKIDGGQDFGVGDPGVVERTVDAAVPREYAVNHLFDLRGIGDVAGQHVEPVQLGRVRRRQRRHLAGLPPFRPRLHRGVPGQPRRSGRSSST